MTLSRSRVPLLVLAHLGLLPFAACKEDDTHVVAPIGSATATDSASASASAPASVTASASVTATTSAALKPGECRQDSDCPPYAECTAARAHPPGSVGACMEREHYNLGRPLVVDGQAHVAPYARPLAITSFEAAALARAAREEHASIAAFARTISELMALGAPTWLLFETQSALADEIRHTELTLDALARLTGEPLVLGPLPAAAAPLRGGPTAAEELFRDVFRGGAVGETIAAASAESARDGATNDELRALYHTICSDEAKHAALAFKTLRWLLGERPELTRVLAEEKARLSSEGTLEERLLVAPLLDVLG